MSHPIKEITQQLSHIIFGKEQQIKLAVCCLLCRGHLLIEDLPGMGKTTLSHGLADVLGLSYQRVQFTSDLLPADVIGSAIFDSDKHKFTFHAGPIFSQVLLGDEINRASPKTQSALLEAMEERQVTVDGVSHPLPEPFFVIATQNPIHQAGTHPLPESQLDRFFMRISLGYPSEDAERKLILGIKQNISSQVNKVIDIEELFSLQAQAGQVKLAQSVLDYILALVKYTRESGLFTDPLSPRASIALGHGARTWALMDGRDYATHDDVQAVFGSIAAHRLNIPCHLQEQAISDILHEVVIPL
ncbi:MULTISPECIES: AAA family ATPase [Pseudoalteromonas]|uniref:AAA family ATPase n=1 Tax=Pseudoalteromonas amylolytica TaxID=1859457 RepID=A0A1S1MXC6_9GAMM|nr:MULTISPECIES: AAA family ATPase [Pseudoalteromonas]OHU88098.1 AAA family ATPase [Pseudoalteromonas sp. JW3]OHU91538.1 AAA family ATPase [Pseudoalteromonas amylolytica]